MRSISPPVISRLVSLTLAALTAVIAVIGALGVSASIASAAEPDPTTTETARLLGYMWGDGTRDGEVWDVNGPSGTSSLIEELVEAHGGEWVNRDKLQFRLPAPFDWEEWKDGLPDDTQDVRDAVKNQHFLSAVLETEASVDGQVYDQSACCVPGYTRGRLTELRDMMRDRGFSTANLVEFNNVDSGRITLDESEWRELRGSHRFVCPVANSDIRLPGGSEHGGFGNIRWFNAGTRWASLVRTDCVDGQDVPPVQPTTGSCSVTIVDASSVRVSWTQTLGEAAIRRDGAFVTSASGRDGVLIDRPGDGTFSYQVRLQAFGLQSTATCGSVTLGDGAPDGPCTVSATAGGVLVQWDDFDKMRYAIRRNGSWVATVSDGSTSLTTTTGSINDTWTMIYRDGGAAIAVPCTAGGQPPADGPCTVTATGGGVLVDWDDIAGVSTYQVRRGGRWLQTVTGSSQLAIAGGALNDAHTVRYRQNGAITDLLCVNA